MTYFSIVIAVYNKEKYIAETLKSVLDQTYQHFEIVILNDGSTDNSEAEILKFKDPRIRYFSKKNAGASAARNFAIAQAKFEFIALMDADDYWYPFYLEEQLNSIKAFSEESVFATATQIKRKNKVFNNEYSINPNLGNPLKINYFEGSFLTSLLHSSSSIVHRRVFEKVGAYNPKIKSGEDIDLYIRIGLEYEIVFSTRICAMYVIRPNSLLHSVKNMVHIADFEAYENLSDNNTLLKRFLDLNRYSLCITAKLVGDREVFQKNLEKIDQSNLSKKQIFLLKQNKTTLKYLMSTKKSLEKLGLRLGTFK